MSENLSSRQTITKQEPWKQANCPRCGKFMKRQEVSYDWGDSEYRDWVCSRCGTELHELICIHVKTRHGFDFSNDTVTKEEKQDDTQ